MAGRMKVFAGNANRDLALSICKSLDRKLSKAMTERFADGEIWVKLGENVRGEDVFILQSTFSPAENLLELLILTDAAKRASAARITAVIPYFGYARQDKKDEPRMPISAKLVSNLISRAGADRILTMDLHADQIQGYFDVPVDHLYAAPVLARYIRRKNRKTDNLVVVSPDLGGAKRAREFANRLGGLEVAFVQKMRPRPNQSSVVKVIGDVEGKDCLILDDILDTGGTIVNASLALRDARAKSILVCCVHALFSGDAMVRIAESPISEVVVTDTVPLRVNPGNKLKIVSVSGLLSEAMKRIHENRSVSSLFK